MNHASTRPAGTRAGVWARRGAVLLTVLVLLGEGYTWLSWHVAVQVLGSMQRAARQIGEPPADTTPAAPAVTRPDSAPAPEASRR